MKGRKFYNYRVDVCQRDERAAASHHKRSRFLLQQAHQELRTAEIMNAHRSSARRAAAMSLKDAEIKVGECQMVEKDANEKRVGYERKLREAVKSQSEMHSETLSQL